MRTFLLKKIILFVFFILFVNSYCYAVGQGDVTEELKIGTVMFLKKDHNDHKKGEHVIFVQDQGNGKYFTSLGPIDKSLLETKMDREQRLQSDAKRDEFNLVLNNSKGCKIEFAPPHQQLIYVGNISLKRGEYDVSVSKRLYLPISLHIPMDKDVTFDVELESIFTNYGGGYIDELIKSGEIGLDEEFEGKTLLHQLIDNFANNYKSFDMFGQWEGLPEDAPIDDLLNAIEYFINKGFDINKPDSSGRNLLSNVIRGPVEVVALLFQNGAKVQPEFINKGNDYAGLFQFVGFGPGDEWNEKLLHLFPEELLTEILNREVDRGFALTDSQFIKLLLEGGAYPFDAFARNDKDIKAKISGRIVLVMGEEKSYSYLKWATENHGKIKQWKEKQQINFKVNSGQIADIKDYINRHPDSLQYITDWKMRLSVVGSEGMTIKEIADRIAGGATEDELMSLITANEDEYLDSFTAEQKQYLIDEGLSPRLIGFLEEHTRQVKIIKEEERAMLAMLQQEEERRTAEAAAIAEAQRQEQINARRRAEREKTHKNRELFGKGLALIAGGVIANSAPLDNAAKTDFLTNYSTDVLTNNKSMSNTQQWANAAGQQSTQTASAQAASGGGSNEVARNKQISSLCKQDSNRYDDGDGQTTSHCRTAIYNKCVANKMCTLYPSKCGALRSRVTTSCNMMSQMGFNGCPACN